MGKSFSRELAEWMAKVDKQLSNLSSGNRLDHASLDGTTLYLRDADGNLSGRLGRQPDGSNGVHVVRVQPPPQLTAAILTVGEQAGTCLVEWDGGTFDGRRMPLIHGHTEIWAELVGDEWEPTVAPGDSAKRVGTIRDRTGGEATVSLPQAGTWAVWLRAMGADRETAGPWSPVAVIEIAPLVDNADIEHAVSEAEERLNTGLDAFYAQAQDYAEQQASDAVNQAAANAQSEYDRLQEIAERALSRAGDNVLEDPSFETSHWFNQWTSSWFQASPTSLSRSGDQAMAVVRVENTSSSTFTFDTVDVEPDDSWRFSIWYRSPDGDAANLENGLGTIIRIRDGADNSTLAESTVFAVSEEWTRATVTFTVPDGVESLNANLRLTHTTGTLIVDDVAFQEVGAAAEALRLAEVARQEAEAAHLAAGEATQQAASAWDRAGNQGSILGGISAPSGVAPEDSYWIQWDSYGEDREPVAVWKREGGAWESQPVDPEFFPLVDIAAATIGQLHGDRITANSIDTTRLRVGPSNMIADPSFNTLGNGDERSWVSVSGDWYTYNASWSTRPLLVFPSSLTDSEDVAEATYGGTSPSEASIPCEPGDTFKLRFQVLVFAGSSSSDDYRAEFQWVDADGAEVGSSVTDWGDRSNQQWHEDVFTAPEGAAWFYVRWRKVGTAGLRRGFGNVSIQQMADASLIVDGSIDTRKLYVTEEMVGEVAKLIRIEAGSLASNDIEAMRIVSSLIEATTYLIHNADGDVSVRLDGVNNFIAGELNTFATPAERDAQLGANVAEGTTASTSSPSMDWRREDGVWVPQPGAWKLDSVNFSNQPTDDPQRLHIHPELQGMFSRYEVVVRASVVEAGNTPSALMVIINDDYGSSDTHYRVAARAERADGQVVAFRDEVSTNFPRMGYLTQYESYAKVDLTPFGTGNVSYMTWDATGWANAANNHGGFLIRAAGRWNRSGHVPITHFGVRPATGANRTWGSSAIAELWGYR